MFKVLKTSILFPAFLAGTFWACNSNSVNPDDQINPVEIPSNIAAGTTTFAFDLFKNLQATQPANENLFVSPLSLHMALGMLLNGAENETAAEILKTLQMEGISLTDLNKAYQTLIKELPLADSKVNLGLANSVWHRSEFQVETDFKNVLKDSFDAEINGLTFNDAAKDKINQWASEKTNGKIKKVIDQIKPEQVMFLLNALYFKGDWKYQFDAKNTIDTDFKLEAGSSKTVKMMYTKSDFRVAAGSKYNAIELPYANGQFNVTLLIPQGQNTIGSVMSGITAQEWSELQSTRLTEKNVEVGLPRFTFSYSAKLNTTLEKMGITRAFTNAAQLGKINKTADLFVDFVKQDTYLGVDEKGTEAAAVTTVGIGVESVGPEDARYICDRPFALIISEKTSNTILFMGRMMNPDSK
ncbi:serpin family protein [Dyadobacter psychrotolerans]|uniref:Serpin family protein n=1 Tax=Dyadobacter psychrotolerans TaxID=2541721 RepID=A0A4R5DNT9_9BACT|nr:serpin family protein [Dyadobacter psychrotolerans]TDE13824.1 serpin family protein [Dyadobacter psychrotolerans]